MNFSLRKSLSLASMLFFCFVCAAQAGDTIPYTPGLTTPDGIAGLGAGIVSSFPNVKAALSSWLPLLLIVLGAVQFVLKRVPTSKSVAISGPLGWIANLLTAFQKDIVAPLVLLLIGMLFTMSSCTTSNTIAQKRSILRGACQVGVYSSYTKPDSGAYTVPGVPAVAQGTDTLFVYSICNNEMILAKYPQLGTDIEKARTKVADLILQILGK
jgi:hypothetical protein